MLSQREVLEGELALGSRAEYRVLNSAEIMIAMVDRIGCKPNVFNEDGVYRRDSW